MYAATCGKPPGGVDCFRPFADLETSGSRSVGGAARQAAPGGGSCWGGRRCAPTPLCCSAWGRAAELAAFAALSPLKQTRRVSFGCALARADPRPALLAAPEIAPAGCRPPRCNPLVLYDGKPRPVENSASRKLAAAVSGARSAGGVRNENHDSGSAAGAARRGRFLWRRAAQLWGRRAQRASKTDSPRLFERSERSERSEFSGATPERAAQRSRSEAETATA